MVATLGNIIGAFLMLVLISPLALAIYMLIANKIDVDGDGHADI